MTLPVPPIDPSNPIPKSPFYYPQQESLSTGSGTALVVGSGLSVDYATGVISSSGGSGGVSSIAGTAPIYVTGSPNTPTIGISEATSSTLGSVQAGVNIDISSGIISVKSATLSQAGIVQLNDTTTSNSTTQALTANQGRVLQDQINSLALAGDLILAGTLNAQSSQLTAVTPAGAAVGFQLGFNLPLPDSSNANYYVIVSDPGTYFPPGGGGPNVASAGDWFLSIGTLWKFLNIAPTPPPASETQAGVIEIATSGEVQTGADNTRAVTPFGGNTAYMPRSALTQKGQLVAALGAGLPAGVNVGTDGQVLYACTAAPTGVTWGDAFSGILCSTITAKGAIIVGTAIDTPGTLTAGSNGQQLTVNAGCPTGLEWVSPDYVTCGSITGKGALVSKNEFGAVSSLPVGPSGCVLTANSSSALGFSWSTNTAIPCSLLQKGILITGSTPSVPYALPVGPNGQVLSADSSCVGGLAWCSLPATIPVSCINGKGALITGTEADKPVALSVGITGQFLTANPACPTGLEWITCRAIPCSCLNGSTGGLLVGCASSFGVLGAGANNSILTVDSTLPLGVKWITPPFIQCCLLSGKGQIVTAIGNSSVAALPAGSNGQVLIACSSCPTGLYWGAVGPTNYIPASTFTGPGQLIAGTGTGTYSMVVAPNRNAIGMPLAFCSATPNSVAYREVGQSVGQVLVDNQELTITDPNQSFNDLSVAWNDNTVYIGSTSQKVVRKVVAEGVDITTNVQTVEGGTYYSDTGVDLAAGGLYEYTVGLKNSITGALNAMYRVTVLKGDDLYLGSKAWVNITRLA